MILPEPLITLIFMISLILYHHSKSFNRRNPSSDEITEPPSEDCGNKQRRTLMDVMELIRVSVFIGAVAGAIAFMHRLLANKDGDLQRQIDDLKRELEELKRKE